MDLFTVGSNGAPAGGTPDDIMAGSARHRVGSSVPYQVDVVVSQPAVDRVRPRTVEEDDVRPRPTEDHIGAVVPVDPGPRRNLGSCPRMGFLAGGRCHRCRSWSASRWPEPPSPGSPPPTRQTRSPPVCVHYALSPPNLSRPSPRQRPALSPIPAETRHKPNWLRPDQVPCGICHERRRPQDILAPVIRRRAAGSPSSCVGRLPARVVGSGDHHSDDTRG